MKAGNRIVFEDELVVVVDKDGTHIYRGMEDYEPHKSELWRFVVTTKSGKGHYEWNGLKKYRVF